MMNTIYIGEEAIDQALIWDFLRERFTSNIQDEYKAILDIRLKGAKLEAFDQFFNFYKDYPFICNDKNSLWVTFVTIFYDNIWLLEKVKNMKENVKMISNVNNWADVTISEGKNQTGSKAQTGNLSDSFNKSNDRNLGKTTAKNAQTDNNSYEIPGAMDLNKELLGNQYTHAKSDADTVSEGVNQNQTKSQSITTNEAIAENLVKNTTLPNKAYQAIKSMEYKMPQFRRMFWNNFWPLFDRSAI